MKMREFLKTHAISFLLIISNCIIVHTYAQQMGPGDSPLLLANNSINDISYVDCPSKQAINFSSGFVNLWKAGRYTWELYRDNSIIQTEVFNLFWNSKCSPGGTAPLPNVTFNNVSPISGAYKVRLKVKRATLIHIKCTGFWVVTGEIYNKTSNIINVSSFDDGFECTCNMPFNIDVNCAAMSFTHHFLGGSPFTARARNNLEVGCTIPSGKTSTFIAENRITSKSGFHARTGSNVHVYIDDCPGINKTSGNESVSDTIGVIDADNTILDTTEVKPGLDLSDDVNEEQGNNEIDDIKNVKIYPNPTPGIFIVEITETHIVSNSTIFIYNVLGEIIYKKNVSTPIVTIDLSSNSKGIYYLHIVNGNNIFRGKIIYQ